MCEIGSFSILELTFQLYKKCPLHIMFIRILIFSNSFEFKNFVYLKSLRYVDMRNNFKIYFQIFKKYPLQIMYFL